MMMMMMINHDDDNDADDDDDAGMTKDTLMVFLKEFFENSWSLKIFSRQQKSMQNFPACIELT